MSEGGLIPCVRTLAGAGMTALAADDHERRLARLRTLVNPPARAWFVPGRIEVLGKHTDYAGGRSLLCAMERGVLVVAAPRTDRRVIVRDAGRDQLVETMLAMDAAAGRRSWSQYVATVARRVARNFPDAQLGADIVFESTLPSAAGMSSSSALMIAMFLAMAGVNGVWSTDRARRTFVTREDLAAYLATIENGESFGELTGDRGVGTAGGSEDHTAILCARAGHLAEYRFCPVRAGRVVALEPRFTFAIASSGVEAAKIGAAAVRYNGLSHDARLIVDLWNASTGRGDRTIEAAAMSAPDAPDRLREAIRAGAGGRADELIGRFDQFVNESDVIIPGAIASLDAGDMHAFGAWVDRSQAGAEQALGNQVPETIALARIAREHGAVAASAFGAGFGGSVWALVSAAQASDVLARWRQAYVAAFPVHDARAVFFVTPPGPAAVEVTG